MGKVAEHLMSNANDRLLADNIYLIQENARLSRVADANHRACLAAHEDLERAHAEIRRLNEVIAAQRRLLAERFNQAVREER